MSMSIFSVVGATYNLIKSLNPVVRYALGASCLLLGVLDLFMTLWGDLFTRVDAIVGGTYPAADFSPLALMNYVFPFDTFCTYLVAYSALRLACAAVRIVKSFIPTVA